MLRTKYGNIEDYQNLETFPSGQPSSVVFTGHFEIDTPAGVIIPQYAVEEHGRQALKPVTFYTNGNLRKVPLQDASYITTRYGRLSAEMVIFHDDGSVKKLFPLNGKLSGYWGEQDEYTLAEDLALQLPSGPVEARVISITFFPSGSIRSLTLWPGETIEAATPAGRLQARVGISFYEDGAVRSVEPAGPSPVETRIGTIYAYDNDPLGIVGDVNSLKFDESGRVTTLSTTTSAIRVTDPSGNQFLYTPLEKAGLCSDLTTVTVPLVIEFTGDTVRFGKDSRSSHPLSGCTFEVTAHTKEAANPVYECS